MARPSRSRSFCKSEIIFARSKFATSFARYHDLTWPLGYGRDTKVTRSSLTRRNRKYAPSSTCRVNLRALRTPGTQPFRIVSILSAMSCIMDGMTWL